MRQHTIRGQYDVEVRLIYKVFHQKTEDDDVIINRTPHGPQHWAKFVPYSKFLYKRSSYLGDHFYSQVHLFIMTGGIDPRMHIKNPIPSTDSFVYDIKCNAWIKIMPMNTARMYHSLCSLCGMVYAIGGQDGDNRYLY